MRINLTFRNIYPDERFEKIETKAPPGGKESSSLERTEASSMEEENKAPFSRYGTEASSMEEESKAPFSRGGTEASSMEEESKAPLSRDGTYDEQPPRFRGAKNADNQHPKSSGVWNNDQRRPNSARGGGYNQQSKSTKRWDVPQQVQFGRRGRGSRQFTDRPQFTYETPTEHIVIPTKAKERVIV